MNSQNIRSNIYGLLRISSNRKILLPFFIMAIYTVVCIFYFSKLSIWDYKYIKDIILWVLFIGITLCYNAAVTEERLYYIEVLKSNLKFIVVIEFIVSLYTFSIIIEVFLVLFATMIVIIQSVIKYYENLEMIKKLIAFLQIIFGSFIFYASIKNILLNYEELNALELAVTFSIPLIMTIMFLPVAYVFGLYSNYEQLYLRLKFRLSKDKKLNKKVKLQILLKCKLSLKKIQNFNDYILAKTYRNMNEEDLKKLITNYK